jgi:hypothetical protein
MSASSGGLCKQPNSAPVEMQRKMRAAQDGGTHTFALSRHNAPEACQNLSPKEGVGNAGCPLHPQPRVQCIVSTRVSSPRSHRDHPAFPHAMVLTAYTVLSPAIGFSCHRRLRKLPSANLTPASRRQDHTTSPSAISALVKAPPASTASRPASVTIASRPSGGTRQQG